MHTAPSAGNMQPVLSAGKCIPRQASQNLIYNQRHARQHMQLAVSAGKHAASAKRGITTETGLIWFFSH